MMSSTLNGMEKVAEFRLCQSVGRLTFVSDTLLVALRVDAMALCRGYYVKPLILIRSFVDNFEGNVITVKHSWNFLRIYCWLWVVFNNHDAINGGSDLLGSCELHLASTFQQSSFCDTHFVIPLFWPVSQGEEMKTLELVLVSLADWGFFDSFEMNFWGK